MRTLLSTLLLALFTSFTNAQVSNSSVFIYENLPHGGNFVFALQADRTQGDLYFHLSAPKYYSWVGVGIGGQMTGALTLIIYEGGDGREITMSPRYAIGNSEPIYDPDIDFDPGFKAGPDSDTADEDGSLLQVDAVCRGCVTWRGGGMIDLTSSAQPFIFAVGPPAAPVQSDSKSAGLTEHSFVGHFAINMPYATLYDGAGTVPPGPYTNRYGATEAYGTQETSDPGPHIHGLVMSIVFVLLFPLGSLVLRAWNKVKGHVIVQVIATILFVMAFAGGIVISKKYNRSRHYNSAHQVIGIMLLIAILSQLVLGVWHHRIFKKEQRKTIKGWIHLYLGPAIIVIGLINGGLGFVLARTSFLAIPYVIVIVVVALIYTCVRFFVTRRRKQNEAFNKEAARPDGGHQFPRFAGQPAPPPPQQPPTYNEGRGEWRAPYGQDVPLERFHSKRSVRKGALRTPEGFPKGSFRAQQPTELA